VVGFDLDMTLFDTRPGVKRVWQELSAATGVDIDVDLVISRLGPPLAVELANWVPTDRTDEFVEGYRALYPVYAIAPSLVMPGAREALAAVHAAGGHTMLVTAKTTPHARLHVDHSGLAVDIVAGDVWGAGKGPVLREAGATVYVGDHVLDVAGAKAADAIAVAVTTGPSSSAELVEAGADAVLDDLTAFPGWLEHHVREAAGGGIRIRREAVGWREPP
jgi:phosphoglycolate phosphatase